MNTAKIKASKKLLMPIMSTGSVLRTKVKNIPPTIRREKANNRQAPRLALISHGKHPSLTIRIPRRDQDSPVSQINQASQVPGAVISPIHSVPMVLLAR
jgi:hypothetical protein